MYILKMKELINTYFIKNRKVYILLIGIKITHINPGKIKIDIN
jgi:hypothetical protein